MKPPLPLVYAVAVVVCLGVPVPSGAASVVKKEHTHVDQTAHVRAHQIPVLKSNYTAATGLEATPANLTKSIVQQNPQGHNQVTAQYTAIQLIGLIPEDSAKAIESLLQAFRQTESDGVKASCIISLMRLDPAQARAFGKPLVNDPKFELGSKLTLANTLAPEGELWVYPVLRQALMSEKGYFKKLTQALLNTFRTHDGEVWNDRGEKIDVAGLLHEFPQK